MTRTSRSKLRLEIKGHSELFVATQGHLVPNILLENKEVVLIEVDHASIQVNNRGLKHGHRRDGEGVRGDTRRACVIANWREVRLKQGE